MARVPCSNPAICGVTSHNDPSKCMALKQLRLTRMDETGSIGMTYVSGDGPVSSLLPTLPEELIHEIDGHENAGGSVILALDSQSRVGMMKWYDAERRYHRENGPAYSLLTSNGMMEVMGYYIHGVYHRENGPAFIHLDTVECDLVPMGYPLGSYRYHYLLEGSEVDIDEHYEWWYQNSRATPDDESYWRYRRLRDLNLDPVSVMERLQISTRSSSNIGNPTL